MIGVPSGITGVEQRAVKESAMMAGARKVYMIEEPMELNDVAVSLRLDERMPRMVYLAPGRQALEFTVEDNYATTCIPRVTGWAVVVFEE